MAWWVGRPLLGSKSVDSIASIVTVSIVKRARPLLKVRSGRRPHRQAIASDLAGRSFASGVEVRRHLFLCQKRLVTRVFLLCEYIVPPPSELEVRGVRSPSIVTLSRADAVKTWRGFIGFREPSGARGVPRRLALRGERTRTRSYRTVSAGLGVWYMLGYLSHVTKTNSCCGGP